MKLELNGFHLELSLQAQRHGYWIELPLARSGNAFTGGHEGLIARVALEEARGGRAEYRLSFSSPWASRLRVRLSLRDEKSLFHLIPGNIHGDNNAAFVRAGEFPCLTGDRHHEKNRAALWEMRADRSSHPVSMVCCDAGAVGVSIAPYSDCAEMDEGFIRNGVLAALPDACGVSMGYGNDPLTFMDKMRFLPATADLCHGAEARGTIYAVRGGGRMAAHEIVRDVYEGLHERATFRKSYREALRALAEAFAKINWMPEIGQYTNRRCRVPVDTELRPWRAIVEIGWTGGSMMAYPLLLAERAFGDLRLPRGGAEILNAICGGFNEKSGLIFDAVLNRQVVNRPAGWNESMINGWWSGFLPQTLGAHCAYTNGHAAYNLLRSALDVEQRERWVRSASRVLDTAVELQREDGAFGYLFSADERRVTDFDGFAGCWFAAALPLACKITGEKRYREAAARAMGYYRGFVRGLACWGSPMDTCRSVDSEGNLAFIRAARLMHEMTGESEYLEMLAEGAKYEYLWRYGFRSRPECRPLKGSNWSSCGGSITSVSNPHIHPMSVVASGDLEYLARVSGDGYHRSRADDGMAWLMNTMELYPEVMGYGAYGVLSERTCPSDGLLLEQYHDTGEPASTWWSYNAWAAASAMEAVAGRGEGVT